MKNALKHQAHHFYLNTFGPAKLDKVYPSTYNLHYTRLAQYGNMDHGALANHHHSKGTNG